MRIALLAMIAAAGLGVAAGQAASKPNPEVSPGVYAPDASHTRVLFSVSHMNFSTWYGEFGGVSGSLKLDPKNPAASKLVVEVETAKVSTSNLKLDEELRSADWLDAAKYPTIRFVSTQVTRTAPDKALVTGDLTLHGVTRPVTLTATFHGAGVNPLSKAYTAGFEVSGTIKRSDFGVKTYVPMIGDEVTLLISAPFERKSD